MTLFGRIVSIYAGLLNAQTDYRPGYVIKTTGDTIHGEILYKGRFVYGQYL
jgi:hypothetical protein